jgi:hypothetical protein
VVSVRLRPRNTEQVAVQEGHQEFVDLYLPAKDTGRLWFNVSRQSDTEWVFEVVKRGALDIREAGLQARLDIDFIYTNALGESPMTARLLFRPTYGSSFFAESWHTKFWYAEGTRHRQGTEDAPVEHPPEGKTPEAIDARAAAQNAASPLVDKLSVPSSGGSYSR